MTENCVRISAAIDRFQEAHFWLHMMQQFYHDADPFRWHLNVFLKAIKEVPQIVQMELQNVEGFSAWFRPHYQELKDDELYGLLSKNRDFVVHRGMLVPNTRAVLGVTEGRGMKLGLTLEVHPLEDSVAAMERYLHHAIRDGDFLGLLTPDEDSLPCVERHWGLKDHDDELIDLCGKTWLRVGKTLDQVLRWLGEEDVPELSLACLHSNQRVHFRLFQREQLIEQFEAIKSGGT